MSDLTNKNPLEKELEALKKKLDNSKFSAQCSIHELEYDKNTLIKENEELKKKIEKLERLLTTAVILIKEGDCMLEEQKKFMKKVLDLS